MSLSVLVVGDGKPYHVSVTEADRLEHDGIAVWQKRGRRIKITKGKRSRLKVRGFSCYVGESVAIALRHRDRTARDIARAFVGDQFHKREPVATA